MAQKIICKKIEDITYDPFGDSHDRDRLYSFKGEINDIRKKILRDASTKMFIEMDSDANPGISRRNYEKAAVYYISTGDIFKITELISEAEKILENRMENESVPVGELSENTLIQEQSLFISSVTICTRAAVDGGLPEIIAYNLSDAYIQNALKLREYKKITELSRCMVFDFTYEVYKYKYRNCSILVRKCCDYINRHLHEPITLKTLSELTNKSANYISDLFYKDIKYRPTVYIRKLKLNYARHILESTDLSVSSVSDLLAFPSTSSFISYFKDEFGETPLMFKRKNMKSE